ncbi:MAG: hypothetical protein K0R98_147 [Rickettsiaceae bacterium]|jgi:4'-phosphopantetheinyl transferase|nr:hypothetical protein [Rickettsiaceae bacterium]
MQAFKNNIHLWKFDLVNLTSRASTKDLLPLLSPEEQSQSTKYKIPEDRARFCTGRYMLRILSSNYLNIAPLKLQLINSNSGKPYWQGQNLHFNISHSGNYIIIGFARNHIGIDIEQISDKRNIDFIAKHYFHQREIDAINCLPQEQQKQKFYDIWARKEAVIKALGTDLFSYLQDFSVLANTLELNGQKIQIETVSIADEYASAIALVGDNMPPVKQFEYDDYLLLPSKKFATISANEIP